MLKDPAVRLAFDKKGETLLREVANKVNLLEQIVRSDSTETVKFQITCPCCGQQINISLNVS